MDERRGQPGRSPVFKQLRPLKAKGKAGLDGSGPMTSQSTTGPQDLVVRRDEYFGRSGTVTIPTRAPRPSVSWPHSLPQSPRGPNSDRRNNQQSTLLGSHKRLRCSGGNPASRKASA